MVDLWMTIGPVVESTTEKNITNITTPSHDNLDSEIQLIPNEVLICTGVFSSLSIFGAILIFLSYVVVTIPVEQKQMRRLLLYLTISDLLIAVGNLIGTIRYAVLNQGGKDKTVEQHLKICEHSGNACILQSAVSIFGSLSSFFWTLVIGLHLFLVVRKKCNFSFKRRAKFLAHTFCWGLPAIITVFAASAGVLGENFAVGTSSWCWIKRCYVKGFGWTILPFDSTFWMTITGKGWEVLTYLIAMWFYIMVKYFMYNERSKPGQKDLGFKDVSLNQCLRNEDENFLWIWLVLYLLRIWGTVRYFIGIIIYGDLVGKTFLLEFQSADKVLMYFQAIGDSSQAFCNAILFVVLDQTIRQEIRWYCLRKVSSGRIAEYTSIS